MPAKRPGINGDAATVFALLWKKRLVVCAGVLLGSAAGVTYALFATQWFKAEVVMLPATGRSVTGSLSQLGGLASLAGINLNNQNSPTEALAVLRSREFSRRFIDEERLLHVLFADKWNAASNSWSVSSVEKQPDLTDATEFFQKHVFSVAEDKRTGEITLAITWTARAEAAAWANALVSRINDQMRAQALAEATRNIQYLQGEIATTNLPALQQSLGKVLESEMQKLLMARGSEEFSFKVVDHATVPKKRVRPQRAAVAIAGFFAGLALAVLFVLSRQLLAPGLRDAA